MFCFEFLFILKSKYHDNNGKYIEKNDMKNWKIRNIENLYQTPKSSVVSKRHVSLHNILLVVIFLSCLKLFTEAILFELL